eukprot:CAMPEP_0185282340 /NCGR_PEP_ID=MMETSP1359-20130426/67218_1 /TAXON_ID=552665 /ORGANISM="Bigelowiella longifila, Strain CCMP242" /LENGTH=104 /DNA_ID=CAMNT_0027877873 /DNA_START=460 /DNA_END=775 /DNA_ORIENTATION=+
MKLVVWILMKGAAVFLYVQQVLLLLMEAAMATSDVALVFSVIPRGSSSPALSLMLVVVHLEGFLEQLTGTGDAEVEDDDTDDEDHTLVVPFDGLELMLERAWAE